MEFVYSGADSEQSRGKLLQKCGHSCFRMVSRGFDPPGVYFSRTFSAGEMLVKQRPQISRITPSAHQLLLNKGFDHTQFNRSTVFPCWEQVCMTKAQCGAVLKPFAIQVIILNSTMHATLPSFTSSTNWVVQSVVSVQWQLQSTTKLHGLRLLSFVANGMRDVQN